MAIDYKNSPFTFECISDSVQISLPLASQYNEINNEAWGGSSSPITSLFYKKTGDTTWTDWKALNFAAVTLNQGLTLQISGNNGGNISRSWGQKYNRWKVAGNGLAILYGNISSLFASNVTSVFLGNFWQSCGTGFVDASKLLIPYAATGSLAFNCFGRCYGLLGGPLFSNSTFVNSMHNYCYTSNTVLSCAEVGFVVNSNWSFNDFFSSVQTNGGIFILPQDTVVPAHGTNTIPSNWTVLKRDTDTESNTFGKLYYAEAGTGHSVGDEYTGEDPYAWYYGAEPTPLPEYTGVIFKSTGNTTVSLNKIGSPLNTTIQYTTDGINWANVNGSISLADGDLVAFSGNAKFSKNIQNRYQFSTGGNGTLAVSGELSGLVSSATIEDDYEFNSLFSGCANITDASGLVLPSNTTKWCYANMFIDCGKLSSVPTLPATTLNEWCYSSMFGNCSSLITAPLLPATTLAKYCYYCMFYGCSNIITAPNLPASTLTDWCFNSLFFNCLKLNTISTYFTSWSNATTNWATNLAPTGTFYKYKALSAETSVDKIPSGWTVELYDPTPDYASMPLTFKSHGTTYLNLRSRGQSSSDDVPLQNFYISRNGGAWLLYCAKTGNKTYTNMVYASNGYNAPILTLTDGLTVAFSGTLPNFSYNSQNDRSEWQFNNYTSQNGSIQSNWDSSNYLEVYGNVMSLHNWETLANNQCYRSMFRDSTMISSCWNVVFPSGDNLNRPNGAGALFRGSRVAICPKMIICTASTQPQNFFDYTWNGDSQLMYVGASTPGQGGGWYDNGGGVPLKNTGVFCKSPSTPRPYVNCTVINWHLNDDTYWVVNSSNQETGQQVILNDGGTITYI